MKPLIGVIPTYEDGKFRVNEQYANAIYAAGGIPFIIPYTIDSEVVEDICSLVEGLLLVGGVDVDPKMYGEDPIPQLGKVIPERDLFELNMTKVFLRRNKPLLAICRGLQLLNVCFGGSLFQDIPAQYKVPELLQHIQKAPRNHPTHTIVVQKQSILSEIVGKDEFSVNSLHHQAIKEIGNGLKVSATAKDGIIEAVESVQHKFVVGVQWHPEENYLSKESFLIFSAFVNRCLISSN